MIADIINGGFELFGGAAIFSDIKILIRDKRVQGISLKGRLFFFLWGIWNLYYYASLTQWASWLGGFAITATSSVWLGFAALYAFRSISEISEDEGLASRLRRTARQLLRS